MSVNPSTVYGQGLYDTSNTARAKLGTVHWFDTSNGFVKAMYCRNNNSASVGAGAPVNIGASGWGYCDTTLVGSTAASPLVLGGVAADLAASSAGGYAWVVLEGPQTNINYAATLASSSAARAMYPSGAQMATVAATQGVATNSANVNGPVALLRANAAVGTTGTAAGAAAGNVVDWLPWR